MDAATEQSKNSVVPYKPTSLCAPVISFARHTGTIYDRWARLCPLPQPETLATAVLGTNKAVGPPSAYMYVFEFPQHIVS